MAKEEKTITLKEKWKLDSQLPDGGVGFEEDEDPNWEVEMEGFTEGELAKLDEINAKENKTRNVDTIEEA